MSHILYVYEKMMPTVAITMESELFSGTAVETRFVRVLDISASDIDWADSFVFIRPTNILSYLVAKKAKKLGCFVNVFCDDDLLHLPSTLCDVPWRREALRKCLSICDIITSSSPYIAENYAKLSQSHRHLFSNTIISKTDYEKIPEISKETDHVSIVYAAGKDHSGLFSEYIEPIIPRLAEKYGKRLSLAFVGVEVESKEFDHLLNVEHYPGMPLQQYRQFMRKKHFDIGISPLHIDSFSKCKYFNKYLEYTMVGTVGIYTRTEPYTYIINDGENGFLSDNTPESWYDSLCRAIDDKTLRDSCFETAREQLQTVFNLENNRQQVFSQIPEFLVSRDHKIKCGSLWFSKSIYCFFRLFDIVYISLWNFKKGGIKQMIKKWKNSISFRNMFIEKGV